MPWFIWVILLSPFIAGIALLARKHAKTGAAILVIYGVLVGSFVIHAELERRSTSGHILRWLKGEYGDQQSANDFAEDAKKAVNPSELQQSALIILYEYRHADSGEIPADKVPASIRNLTSDGVPFEDAAYDRDSASEPCIFFFVGRPIWTLGFVCRFPDIQN